jgi:hypothetical protein
LIGSNYYGEFNKTPLVDPSRPLSNSFNRGVLECTDENYFLMCKNKT